MEDLEALVADIPSTTDAEEKQARTERVKGKPDSISEVEDSDVESAGEVDAEDESEGESEVESDDDSDTENTVLVVSVDGQELELPGDTPKQAIEAIKKMEKELYTGFQRKTQEVAEEKRQLESRIEQSKAESLEVQRVEIQKAQARVQAIAQAAFTPEDVLLELADTDREAYKYRSKLNSQISQQWQALNAHFEQVDAGIKEQKQKALQARGKVAWQRLEQEKLSEGDVQKIIQDSVKAYGLGNDYVENLADAEQVLMMRDALKWRELKEQNPQTRKRIAKSEKATPKNATSPKPQVNKSREQRFKNRTASMEDLADFLMTSQG